MKNGVSQRKFLDQFLRSYNNERCRALSAKYVNAASGLELHRFKWLDDALIGELPKEWNWLPDEFGPNERAKLVHWTLGAPCFREFADEAMAEEWHSERRLLNTPEER